ncbi:hypothetical protein rosag_00950 [Roseisolibacter agri]|uniref:Tetratricopeptide repeat protein n=1 Tax=Roseisolibacter agri TaxID=2014610 RepID=A0AA37Q4E9_9BACT|nr:hypothetical protein rosag_00950 [Roseisolibacter agri]
MGALAATLAAGASAATPLRAQPNLAPVRGGGPTAREPAAAARTRALVDSTWAAYARGDRPGTVARAERALEELPSSHRNARFAASVAAGRALADMGDAAAALPHLERALALDTLRDAARGWALAYVGKVRYALGDPERAREALAGVAALRPTTRLAATVATDWRLFGFDTTYARWISLRTPHLRLRVSPTAPILDRAAFADVRERAAMQIAAALGDTSVVSAPKPIDMFIWDTETEAHAAGLTRVHFARPTVGLTHMTWDQTVGHELAHVIAYRAVRPVVATLLVTEGVAVYFDGSTQDRVGEAAAALSGLGTTQVDVRALWADWDRLPPGVAYPVAGAVIDALARGGDLAQLRALLRVQTLAEARRIYGPALDAWLDLLEQQIAARAAALLSPQTPDARP